MIKTRKSEQSEPRVRTRWHVLLSPATGLKKVRFDGVQVAVPGASTSGGPDVRAEEWRFCCCHK